MNLFKNPHDTFLGELTEPFSNKPVIQSNYFSELNERDFWQIASLSFTIIQKIIGRIEFFGKMGGNRGNNEIVMRGIELGGGNHHTGALFESGQISERERNEQNITRPISGHRLYHQGCSRNQMTVLPISSTENRRRKFLKDGGDALKTGVALPVWLLRLCLQFFPVKIFA